jgi:hypothetical protein
VKAKSNCRSCKAPIVWAITAAKGARMPLDPDPVDDGNVWVVRWKPDGTPIVAVALHADAVPILARERFVSHFTTCPDSKEWRKKQ